MMISPFDKVENTVGKGENSGYKHYVLFPQCFPKPPSLGSLKVGIVRFQYTSNGSHFIQGTQLDKHVNLSLGYKLISFPLL